MKLPFFLFIFSFLGLYNPSVAQILEQNFDRLENLTEFQGNDPNEGQVDTINLEVPVNGEPIFSLGSDGDGSKYLNIYKQGDRMRHFSRLKGLNDEGFLKISFSFSVDPSSLNITGEAQRFAVLIAGGNLYKTSSIPQRVERWGQIGIHINSNGSFFLANEGRKPGDNNAIIESTDNYTEKKHITLVMNNSMENVIYTGPGGEEKEIQQGKVDIWVGEVREVENSEAYLGSNANLSSVKFLLWNNSSLTAIARLDDLVISNDQGFDPLPVVLTAFSAKKAGDDVLLDWETASEKNSSHFEVERSPDGEQFEKVGRVSAAGNSHIPQSYSFYDRQAGQKFGGTLYYRLHQVDTDGFSEYSPVRHVELPAPLSGFRRVFPNPFEGELNVGLLTDKSLEVSFRLLNLQGTLIAEDVKITEPAGQEQVYSFSGTENLPSGMYILEIGSAGEKKRFRLVKL